MKRTATLLLTVAGLGLWPAVSPVLAADTAAANGMPLVTNLSLSSSSPSKRADWQRHLTLGPGDVLAISMVDQKDSERNDVTIGPDGRINYMEVQNFVAAGLTVDEMRAKLDDALGRFYRTPRSVVIPVAYRSKKFFMLGAVQTKGVFPLDKPTSIVEAVARAGGLESGIFDRSPVELADLSHSFLVRNGKQVPVDFEKLFLHGDLAQNISLEPNDYLFFTPASMNEIFVLGAVAAPGPQPSDRATTVISAITRHGSFAADAYRQRVLVIRGSLTHPETFVVNTADILDAKIPDFKLEPHDIVYVHSKPWTYAEDLLKGATTAFIQAALVTYTGQYIGPLITKPIINP